MTNLSFLQGQPEMKLSTTLGSWEGVEAASATFLEEEIFVAAISRDEHGFYCGGFGPADLVGGIPPTFIRGIGDTATFHRTCDQSQESERNESESNRRKEDNMFFRHRVLQEQAAPRADLIAAASQSLLETSLRVLGTDARKGDRFRWISQVLDGVCGDGVPVAALRVACFERLWPTS